MSDDEDVDWSNYESGPFCRHFSDMSCGMTCAACGHRCTQHGAEDGDYSCNECDCKAWEDEE